ncbi:MAG: cupredoxin family copper-binding protein [bacterium]|nr:cupredoxin family copper-binding protein [bacterium]
MGKLITLIIIILVIGAGYALLQNNSQSGTETSTITQTPTQTPDTKREASPTQSPSEVETNKVTVQNFSFIPPVITIRPGTTVTWVNEDSTQHDITSDPDSKIFKSKLLGNRETFSFTFNKAGVYDYRCTPHSFMKGKVIVR